MKLSNEPLKRIPVVLRIDADNSEIGPVSTDRTGVARFDIPSTSGKVLVSGIERYHGRLDGEIAIALWSITQSSDASEGTLGEFPAGSNAYPGMETRVLDIDGYKIVTDSEGYLVNPDEWNEAFARAQAKIENLQLNAEHWEVIRFLREYFTKYGTQASVREMIKHFRTVWDDSKSTSRYLHSIFPRGGPQKQGNRLAGLLRTKGEH